MGADNSKTSGSTGASRLALVTGGAGFIGSNLVNAQIDRGLRVRILDNFTTCNRSQLDLRAVVRSRHQG
jgi:UDP-glucose 4-epimerase